MSDHNNIYNIMGKLNALTPVEQPKQETKAIYESVEARGSVLEGVKKVQARLQEKFEQGMEEERETQKTKKGTIYKGGKYGTSHDAGEEDTPKKKKEKSNSGSGSKHSMPKGDIFGRTTGKVPKGEKGKTVAGSAKSDRTRNKQADDAFDRDEKTLKEKAPKGWEGTVKAMKKHKEIDNPWALANSMKNKGYKSHKKEEGVEEGMIGNLVNRGKQAWNTHQSNRYLDKAVDAQAAKNPNQQAIDSNYAKARKYATKAQINRYNRTGSTLDKWSSAGQGSDQDRQNISYLKSKGLVKENTISTSKALLESVNFKKMVDEANMSADEMLECINQDIQAYKATGDMSDRLRDFMHLHRHIKDMEEAAQIPPASLAPHRPSPEEISPTKKPGIVQRAVNALKGPSDEELLANLEQDVQPHRTMDEQLDELARLAGLPVKENPNDVLDPADPKDDVLDPADIKPGHSDLGDENDLQDELGEDEAGPVQMYQESKKTNLEDIARLSGIFQEGKDYGDTDFNEPPVYDNTPNEQIQGEEVLLKGGDGEVAGGEKQMRPTKPTFKNGDNALAEDKELIKPAAEFNYVEAMGRDLMQAYQGIKTK